MAKSKADNWEELFRMAIRRSGMTLEELESRSDVDKSQISRFLRGERGLSITTAERIAKEVGLELKAKKAGRK